MGPRWREDDVIFYVGPTSIAFCDTLIREESFSPVARMTALIYRYLKNRHSCHWQKWLLEQALIRALREFAP